MNFDKELTETCPFCKKGAIKIIEKPSYTSFKTSRGSGVSNTFPVFVKGDFRVASNCPECGKTRKEIQIAIFGDV